MTRETSGVIQSSHSPLRMTEMGSVVFSPLLAWFGSLALEGASGPLLELGWPLLVGRSSNSCVGHLSFMFLYKLDS